MQPAESIITEEIECHRARRSEIDDQVAELRAEARAIDIVVESLETTLAKLSGGAGKNGTSPQEFPLLDTGPHPVSPRGPRRYSAPRAGTGKATDVVRRFLAEHPEGMRPAEVADAVVNQIETKSDNPRRLVMNTLLNLARQEEVIRGDDGRYRPTEEN